MAFRAALDRRGGFPKRPANGFLASLALAGLLVGCTSAPPLQATQDAAAFEESAPPEALQQFEQAVLHMNAGDFAAAEQGLRAVAAQYPAYSGALVNLGILQVKAGRLDEAEQTLREAVERNDVNVAAFNQLGIVYRRLGRFEDAQRSYLRAVQIDPQYALAWLNLGVLCDLYLQEPQCALDAFERYLALAPTPESKVETWVGELRRRIAAGPQARAE
ncbi:MAG TPA: tetratricopeptide repeat protein [Steroidobacter sp.]|jgi:tetratricopeptide (TPR) repeat protein|nr:tetratricopeptide repeat protein [Steroidobacteraceae bacterium]HLS82611.1 tetratricopeptide repeat protein [Steroidobacter sp.]